VARFRSDAAKANLFEKRFYIKAPIDGIINEQSVHGSGEVVAAGETLFSIVPKNTPMVAEIKVKNQDLAYIYPNQRAALRLDAFPYQRFGRLFGKVESISASTVSTSANGGEDRQPFYVIRIRPEKSIFDLDGKAYAIRSGMTLTADLITHEKSLLSFFTEPMHYHFDKAFRDPTNR
jgi:HlyD family type I secretion membrane fusion protein